MYMIYAQNFKFSNATCNSDIILDFCIFKHLLRYFLSIFSFDYCEKSPVNRFLIGLYPACEALFEIIEKIEKL